MERHCLRQFAIAERLAGDRAFDREVLLCACWLHDVGLFTPSRDPYVTEGARLAARVLEPFGWPPERLQRCMDACEQHHAPRPRMAMGLEVEPVRTLTRDDLRARCPAGRGRMRSLDEAGTGLSAARTPPARPMRARDGPRRGRSHSGESGRVAPCFPRTAGRLSELPRFVLLRESRSRGRSPHIGAA